MRARVMVQYLVDVGSMDLSVAGNWVQNDITQNYNRNSAIKSVSIVAMNVLPEPEVSAEIRGPFP